MAEAYKDLDPDSMPRSPGMTYQDLLDLDTHEVPDVLRLQSPKFMGLNEFSVKRYTTQAYHQLEVAHLWKKVWQFACREEEIPEAGDHYRYDIVGMSFLVVRTETGEIKAYPNACLHRGRMLKEFDGNATELRCPFHGFCWKLDGSFKEIPADWDFPQVNQGEFDLPELPVATWAGFVFINPDQDCAPFDEFIKDLAPQFERWELDGLCKQAHVAKVMPCNWKIAQEAFCEAYHVNGTHPQILRSLGDVNSQIDIWDNCARVITPGSTHSPLLDYTPSHDDMLRTLMDVDHDAEVPQVPDGMHLREFMASRSREALREIAPEKADLYCDAELVDSLDYTLFPNFHPWGAFNGIVYRFRPNGNDHRSAIMECIILGPFTGERPEPAPMKMLEEGESWSSALGYLGKVFDQDSFNMPKVQAGLESTYQTGIVLSGYQESKVRWLHTKLTEWVGE
jgi:phenylpropionate dioxygenase-like ring-hydroxylating dioxygenase large terminal subunit